jgi:glutathione S-transferase
MPRATLSINSKNYGAWSLRGWLLCKLAGLDFAEIIIPSDDEMTRAELLLLSSSFRVPCLVHDGVSVWDTLACCHTIAPRGRVAARSVAKCIRASPICARRCR